MLQKKNKKSVFFFKGSVTVFALLLMFILAVTTIGIISTAAIERKASISTGNSTTAFQIAESGMEKTLQYFKSNFDKKLSDIPSSPICANGVVTYSNNTIRFRDNIDPPDDYITNCGALISNVKIIKSIGTTKQETRSIEEDVFLGATKLLLHFNGWNDNDSFDDSSYYYANRTITNNSSVAVSKDLEPKKLGIGSAKFDGTTGYLSVPDSTDWDFRTGDFTVDFWAWPLSLTTNNTYIEIGSWDDSGHTVLIRQDTPSSLCIYIMGTGYCKAFTPLINNKFYHIAVVRKVGVMRLFIDGKKVDPDNNVSSDIQISNEVRVGHSVHPGGSTQFFNGYIDELRISKGVARWWNDFDTHLPDTEYWAD